jgi:hypothetical protein
LILAACGGGSHAGPSSLPQAVKTKPGGVGTLTLRLTLPARTSSSAKRLPKYVSSATQGAVVQITAGGRSVVSDYSLEPGTPPCAAAANGGSVCTLSPQLPGFGVTTISVSLYDQPAEGGLPSGAALLSTGSITTTIPEGSATVTIPVVLSGVVAGVTAGSTGTLPTGGTAGTTTFTFEATDADANIILAADGAVADVTFATAAFVLTMPPSMTDITIADLTRGTSYASTLYLVHAGDVIAVSSTSTTPQVAGIPVVANLNGIPVGILTIPSSVSNAFIPHPVNTAPSASEIAGVPPWSELPTLAAGTGVAVLSDANTQVTGYSSGGSEVFSCSASASGVSIEHIAMASGENLEVGNAYSDQFGPDLTLANVSLNATTPNCGVNQELIQGLTGGGFLDVANDGGANTAAIYTGGATPSLYVLSGAGSPSIGLNTNPTSASLAMWYGQYVAASTGSNGNSGVVYVNAQGNVATSNVGAISVAVDDAGHAYALDTSGQLYSCSLGSSVSCPSSVTIANASSDHRAVAVGPDGLVYVASSSGLVQFNPVTLTAPTVIGSTSLKEVQASGDGHVYALGTDNQTFYIYP